MGTKFVMGAEGGVVGGAYKGAVLLAEKEIIHVWHLGGGGWLDSRGNRWSEGAFDSEKHALEGASSLRDCYGCKDCYDCVSCLDCELCTECERCEEMKGLCGSKDQCPG
jgi:hypothetical protein